LSQRKEEAGLDNLEVRQVEEGLPLDDESCDLILMVTVFHELDDKDGMLQEIRRTLKTNGCLAIIEFHGYETPMGPPVPHRISKESVQEHAEANGFCLAESFDLGDNFYCQLNKQV
jgi:ubiquinone/menaquinone biosynthesis C-methylase UbiE